MGLYVEKTEDINSLSLVSSNLLGVQSAGHKDSFGAFTALENAPESFCHCGAEQLTDDCLRKLLVPPRVTICIDA